MTKRTLVTFVLDRSSSMSMIKSGTLEALNTYVDTLKIDVEKNGGAIDFTLVQFSSMGIDKTYFEKPIADVTHLTDSTYQPMGGTPLIEAVTNTINALQAAIDAKGDKPKVVFCIQTDGEENSSGPEYSWSVLKELIATKQAQGWQFNFMGAGIDAYQQSGMMGLSASQTVSYSNDLTSTRAAFEASATNTAEFRSGMRRDTTYMGFQKLAAGDEFDPEAMLTKKANKTDDKLKVTL